MMLINVCEHYCKTCDSVLLTLDCISIEQKLMMKKQVRKYWKHVRKHHDIITRNYFIYLDEPFQIRVNPNDNVTRFVLDS